MLIVVSFSVIGSSHLGNPSYIPPNAQHPATCDSATPLEFIFTFPCDSFDEVIYHYNE